PVAPDLPYEGDLFPVLETDTKARFPLLQADDRPEHLEFPRAGRLPLDRERTPGPRPPHLRRVPLGFATRRGSERPPRLEGHRAGEGAKGPRLRKKGRGSRTPAKEDPARVTIG